MRTMPSTSAPKPPRPTSRLPRPDGWRREVILTACCQSLGGGSTTLRSKALILMMLTLGGWKRQRNSWRELGNYERPWCCPERRCAVLYQSGGPPDPEKPGESWVCFGKDACGSRVCLRRREAPELLELLPLHAGHWRMQTQPAPNRRRFPGTAPAPSALWILRGRPEGYKPDRWKLLKMPDA